MTHRTADMTHRVRVATHRAVAPSMAGARQRLRVARLAADVSVGATCADHAQLRAREQLVDADVRVVAAESLSLALLPAVELSMLHAVGGIKTSRTCTTRL